MSTIGAVDVTQHQVRTFAGTRDPDVLGPSPRPARCRRRGSLPAGILAFGVAAVLAAPVLAHAADIAILKSSDVAAWRPALDALRRGLGGHNVAEYDLRGDRAEAARVAGTFKGRSAILVALGPLANEAVRSNAPELPLVFGMVLDPARAGLVGQPNVSGVAFAVPVKNQLAAFRLVNPRGVRIGVIHNKENTGPLVEEAIKAANVVRLILVPRAVTLDREVPESLRSLLRGEEAVDALWIPPDPMLLSDDARRFLLAETLKAGKPVYASLASLVPEGALVSNAPEFASIGEQLAELIGRFAAGDRARPELLVPRAELVINKKIAEKLKIEISEDALRAATRTY